MSGFYIVDSNGTMIELMKPIEDLSVIMPDEYEERADEMIDLLQGLTEPVTFTCPLKNPKRVKRILRRLAKRNGREWRLYKVKTKWRVKAETRAAVRNWFDNHITWNLPTFYVCEEMKKLRDGLKEREISWIDKSDDYNHREHWVCRTHFMYNGDRWSVIHGYGTYGGFDHYSINRELLECQCGDLSEPIGFLTAADVFRIMDVGYDGFLQTAGNEDDAEYDKELEQREKEAFLYEP